MVSPGALAFCGQRLTSYRHFWRSSLISSVVEPALFLASMGLTLGVLVDRGPGLPGGVSYLSFLAPGLLVAAAMQTGTFESTYPVLGAIKWDKTYEAVLATPARVGDLLVGQLLYADDGEAALAAVTGLGVHPQSSLVRRSSLEDVFLRLTGRTLVD